jgi:ABC-type multidrug transport system fused ATPase/permease subunit
MTKLFQKDTKINQDMGTARTFLKRNSPLLIILSLVIVYYIFWLKVLSWDINISVLVWLTGSIIVIQRIVTESIFSYIDFTKEFIKVETLWETFDDAPIMKWYDSWKPFSKKLKDIEIKNISYGYNETKVFNDFSLTIKRWQKTALVWASGGGKTTLMKLIAGYLHPESGFISVIGNRLDETALKSYYPHIGYLTQDPSVFDATIRENLVSAVSGNLLEKGGTWSKAKGGGLVNSETPIPLSTTKQVDIPLSQGGLDTTKQELEKKLIYALKLAHCDFVFDLPLWLDTEIGERWVRLSGWQKQRLAIAKIFLKDPEIILLDEPTSALDSFSEEAITLALDTLFQDRTVIIVAHRLQTVRKADDIIVIEWWQIVERGDHTELVAKWGIYNRMLELQSGF